jgi:6-pyruvoyltetrahydropterin/6-carboxytetrahydropterin synthase
MPHGHQGLVRVHVTGTELNKQKMLLDFKELGVVNDFLDGYLDHKCIVGRDDPLFYMLVTNFMNETGVSVLEKPIYMRGCTTVAAYVCDVSAVPDGPIKEYLEGIVIVDFIPTSEALAQWVFKLAAEKFKQIDVIVSQVDWEETPKTNASYSE